MLNRSAEREITAPPSTSTQNGVNSDSPPAAAAGGGGHTPLSPQNSSDAAAGNGSSGEGRLSRLFSLRRSIGGPGKKFNNVFQG